jgi:hypothetical protein
MQGFRSAGLALRTWSSPCGNFLPTSDWAGGSDSQRSHRWSQWSARSGRCFPAFVLNLAPLSAGSTVRVSSPTAVLVVGLLLDPGRALLEPVKFTEKFKCQPQPALCAFHFSGSPRCLSLLWHQLWPALVSRINLSTTLDHLKPAGLLFPRPSPQPPSSIFNSKAPQPFHLPSPRPDRPERPPSTHQKASGVCTNVATIMTPAPPPVERTTGF